MFYIYKLVFFFDREGLSSVEFIFWDFPIKVEIDAVAPEIERVCIEILVIMSKSCYVIE